MGVLGVVGVLGGIGVREAKAQSLSLGISPPVLEVIIKPGKTITQVFKLVNNGENTIVTVGISEYDEDGIVYPADIRLSSVEAQSRGVNNPSFSPEPWITLLNTDTVFGKPFMFEGKSEKQLILRISPPFGVPEKEYYRVLTVSTTPLPPGETTQSAISQTIGAVILLSVTSSDMEARGGQITNFSLPVIIDSFDALTSNITVKNTGKRYFRPVGKILLSGPLGKAEYDIRPNVILAGQTRKLTTSQSADEEVTLKVPGFYIGKYTLTLGFTLDEGSLKVEQTKYFYAVPWKAGVVGILGVLGAVWVRRRRRKNA